MVDRIEQVIGEYKIGDEAFSSSKAMAINKAVKALSICGVPVEFAKSSGGYLMALAVADYIASLRHRVDLDDEREMDKASFILLSTISESFGVGSQWNLNYQLRSPLSDKAKIRDYVLRYYDPQISDEVAERMGSWDSGSLLNEVRSRLGIIDKESEKPFNVLALSRSSEDLGEDLGVGGIHCLEVGEHFIIFGSDGVSLEHEYIHSQGGFNFGAKGLLFRGFNEACVEGFRPDPRTYIPQRAVLEVLLRFVPGLEGLLTDAYKRNSDERRMFFTFLIDQFGLEGFFQIARIRPSGKQEESIFLNPYDVIGYLNKNWRGWIH